MQKRILILVVTLAVIGYSIYGFMDKESIAINGELASVSESEVFTELFSEESILKEEDLFYSVGGRFKHAITPEKLKRVKSIDDIITDYPSNWVSEYEKVEVLTYRKGEEVKEESNDIVFSEGQKQLLRSLNTSDAIYFNIKYEVEDAESGPPDLREMHIAVAVVPHTPAEYIGGYQFMMDYLKSKSAHKIVGKIKEDMNFTRLDFLVNEDGIVEDVNLKDSSGDPEVDALLFRLISEMPSWNAAKNVQDEPVVQRLEFILTYGDNC